MSFSIVKAELAAAGIKTMADVDVWIRKHPETVAGVRCLMSRHEALCFIVGEKAATIMLNELAVRQCCGKPSGGNS